MSRLLYTLGWWAATPLVVLYLLWRARRQPEYLAHWAERWGFVPKRRDDAPLVWVHAVSVGETRAAQPLVVALLERDPAIRVLLTHMTPTGRETGRELFGDRFGDRVVQCYLPYDGAIAPGRFLRAWRPSVGLLMETELWPNLCAAASRAGVPLALVNARLSEKSLRKGLRWRSLFGPALGSLARVVAQTEADAVRLARLGRTDVRVAGNLKFDVSPDEALLTRGRAWREALNGRPVVLAASTREGEEALLIDAWQGRSGESPSAPSGPAMVSTPDRAPAPATGASSEARSTRGAPLLAVVPRHPQRFDEIAAMLESRGLRVARRSRLDQEFRDLAASEIDVLLGDSMGEMFAWYAMADVAIIGGTLRPFGGQNLIEACAVGTPVILGPSTYNFDEAAEAAVAAGAGRRVTDARGAAGTALALLCDVEAASEASSAARQFADRHRGATRRTLLAIEPLLPLPVQSPNADQHGDSLA